MSDAEEDDGSRSGERRRRLWPTDFKRRIIAESLEPGASVAEVARRHGVNANLLFTWRRQSGAGAAADLREPVRLVPVTIAAEIGPVVPAAASGRIGRMEIVLGGGDRIIVGSDVDATALTRVLKTLSRPGRSALT